MSGMLVALLDIALPFGIVLGLGLWQLRLLRRDRARGEEVARARRERPPEP